MKNIHILPTDRPSRLYKNDDVVGLHPIPTTLFPRIDIYITSDEEIKDGDWYFDENKLKVKRYFEKREAYPSLIHRFKIILTTDPDLIKDGVQAIDDESLEWFVKNPSCESVNFISYGNEKGTKDYELIIPQEEPKFEDSIENSLSIMSIANDMFGKKEEPKQETTSEGFHRISKEIDYSEFDFVSFKIGIEWQQEQDKNKFSEKEVLEILNHHTSYLESFIYRYIDEDDIEDNEKWFEQFKKK
jgi:hypothetical protein